MRKFLRILAWLFFWPVMFPVWLSYKYPTWLRWVYWVLASLMLVGAATDQTNKGSAIIAGFLVVIALAIILFALVTAVSVGAGLFKKEHIAVKSNLAEKSDPPGTSIHWQGPGVYTVDVVGESQFQDVLEAICGKRSPEGENRFVTASLVINQDEIEAQINNRTIGFLREQVTPHFIKKLKQAGYPKVNVICDANIRGGWVRPDGSTGHYGVWLDLPT